MAIIKLIEIKFEDVKILKSISYSLNFIECYFIFGSVNVPNTDKTTSNFAFGVYAKRILSLRISWRLFCHVLCVRTPMIYADRACIDLRHKPQNKNRL